jgi:hypothetical protein
MLIINKNVKNSNNIIINNTENKSNSFDFSDHNNDNNNSNDFETNNYNINNLNGGINLKAKKILERRVIEVAYVIPGWRQQVRGGLAA